MTIIPIMQQVDLKNIDLNLLVALDVLLDERHVTNAASRLNLSQPAMSRTLARLRDSFDDPLLVRVAGGYQRTARADALMRPLKDALDQVRLTFAKPTFDPGTAASTFRICTLDYTEVVISPTFMERITRLAPVARIEIVRRSIYSAEEIMEGHADISLGVMPNSLAKHCIVQPLFEDRYVCLMHKNHPLANTKLTLEDYLDYPHSIIHTGERPGGHIDDALQSLGHSRRVAKRSPYFIASLFSLGESNLLQTVPKRLATPMLSAMNLVMRDLPFDVAPLAISQMWHARDTDNPSHKWFREQLLDAVRALPDID